MTLDTKLLIKPLEKYRAVLLGLLRGEVTQADDSEGEGRIMSARKGQCLVVSVVDSDVRLWLSEYFGSELGKF